MRVRIFELKVRDLNFIAYFYRKFTIKKVIKNLGNTIQSEFMDDFLELVLSLMRLKIHTDRNFRKNIKGFNARYVFKSRDSSIAAAAIFKKERMIVKKKAIRDANITVIFKDGKALWEFLFAEDPDIFAFILDNKLSYHGNINYVLKFGYMAKQLKLMLNL